MLPEGTVALSSNAPFRIEPAIPTKEYIKNKPVEGFIVSYFGVRNVATHVLVVNLDHRTYSGRQQLRRDEYIKPLFHELIGPGPLDVFNPKTKKWQYSKGDRVELRLNPGAALLVRKSTINQ
jgi:hypothetical protein